MKFLKVMEAIWILGLIAFMIKGMLSDFGYGKRFDFDDIYTFSWLAFAMSAYLFCDKIVYSEPRE